MSEWSLGAKGIICCHGRTIVHDQDVGLELFAAKDAIEVHQVLPNGLPVIENGDQNQESALVHVLFH